MADNGNQIQQNKKSRQNDPLSEYLHGWGYEIDNGTRLFEESLSEDGKPKDLYVISDGMLINRIQYPHSKAIISPSGTGKTTVQEILASELSSQNGCFVTDLGTGGKTTRQTLGSFIETLVAGYDEDGLTRTVDGIPMRTAQTSRLFIRLLEESHHSNYKHFIFADNIGNYDKGELEALQIAVDHGSRLFLAGRPGAENRVADKHPHLHHRTVWLSKGIGRFSPGHTVEYIVRSLTYWCNKSGVYDGPRYFDDGETIGEFAVTAPGIPFTLQAIEKITEKSRGIPQVIKYWCRFALNQAVSEYAENNNRAPTEVPVTVQHIM